MLASLANGDILLPGVGIHARGINTPVPVPHETDILVDAVVDVSWQSKVYTFLVECKALSTPKLTEAAIGQAMYYSRVTGLRPMIFVPYLGNEALNRLEADGVSGLDLCGNGIITVPGEMLIFRTGAPNRHPSRRKGPNPYRGASSIVARTLAIQPEFESSRAIERFIQEHGGSVTQGTVSKALDELEEDLMISRAGRVIRALQYDALLDRLVHHYERPQPNDATSYRIDGSQSDIARILSDRAGDLGEPIVVTGLGSASHYTAMAQSPPIPVYCRRLDLLHGHADDQSRFPNVRIIRMADAGVYYDPRCEGGLPLASPVQVYVELMNGGARDREMADQVRRLLPPNLYSTPPIESEVTDRGRTSE
ncbi:MAG: hypothetical protein ACLQVD_18550 [Capsulimonadaceae bacterium]